MIRTRTLPARTYRTYADHHFAILRAETRRAARRARLENVLCVVLSLCALAPFFGVAFALGGHTVLWIASIASGLTVLLAGIWARYVN